MAEPLFDPNKCNVDSVESVDFDFVSECSIAAPPPPIFDCPLPVVTPDPPAVACPEFTGVANVIAVRQECVVKETGVADAGGFDTLIDFSKNWAPDQWVGYYLHVTKGAGRGHPPIEILGNLSTTLAYNAQTFGPDYTTHYEIITAEAVSTLSITRTDIDPCQFAVDLDIAVPIPTPPCPTIKAGDISVAAAYGSTLAGGALVVTRTANDVACSESQQSCEFTIDLNLDIPIPQPPCTTIKAGDVAINVGYAKCELTRGTYVMTSVSGGNITLAITATKSRIDGGAVIYVFDQDGNLQSSTNNGELSTFDNDFFTYALLTGWYVVIQLINGTVSGSVTAASGSTIAIGTGDLAPTPDWSNTALGVSGWLYSATNTVAPSGALTVTKTENPGDADTPRSCQVTLDLDLNIPLPAPPCPTINASGALTYSGNTAPALSFTATHNITPSDDCNKPDTCEIDLDISLALPKPCPEITASGAVIVTSARETPTMVATVTKDAPACEFDIDVSLELPVPRPCPDITGTIVVNEGEFLTGAIAVTALPPVTAADPCAYSIDLELNIPIPCVPELSVTASILETPGRDDPWITCFVEPTDAATGCDKTISIGIELPTPRACPDITGTLTLSDGAALTGVLEVIATPPGNRRDACEYEVNLDLTIPIPCVPNITVTGQFLYTYNDTPSISVSTTYSPTGCNKQFFIDLKVPYPPACPEFDATVDVFEADYYTGWLDITPYPPVTPGDPCTYDLDLHIGVPQPCIPNITATGTILATPGRTEPWMQVRAIAVDAPTGCSKQIQVDIELPVDKKGRLRKGDVTCAWTVCDGGDPTCNVTISEPDMNYEQTIDIAIYIPRPPTYHGGSFTLRDANNNVYGTGVISIDATGCSRGVSGVVYLNTTSCTSGGGTQPLDGGVGQQG